ncbi:MAG: tetratricopeptide repeat protein, partial [archaeon]|nr:tetratricopeptide repeat protein [archaeon]
FIWNLRYPISGKKYFKKAIELDPDYGDAYQYLGQIALRKNQKTRAWYFLEKAIKLNGKNSGRIKRELKSLYNKEFTIFFEEQLQNNLEKQKIIDEQLFTIKALRRQKIDLQKQIDSLHDKVGQIKWKTGHQVKQIGKEKEQDISLIHQKYENQIITLKQEAENTAKEMAEQKFLRLTTEIMESKSDLEEQSLKAAVQNIKKIVGDQIWKMLSKNVQKYLATAEQVYTLLKKQKESSDYSLVGMELCKALETILNHTLVDPFVKYLNNSQAEFLKMNQIIRKNKKPLYHTYLAKVVDQISYPEIISLTLGQYHYILDKTLEGDYALHKYADFLDKIHADSGIIIGKKFLDNLTIVTKQYRNTITHKSPMDQKQCDHLRQLIFTGKNSLLNKSMTA